jgi:hypothetical protein
MGTDPTQESGKQISVMGYRLDVCQALFFLLMLIHGSVVLTTFKKYGVNPDEAGHIDYGHSIVLWYQSLSQFRGIFSRVNIWLYGGLYDTIVHLITKVSPLRLHDTRHLCNALVGMGGVWGAYKIGGLFEKKWIGLLAALFLMLTPRYYGHSFINHKDIPFAVAHLWSLYLIIKAVERLPQLSPRMILALGLSIGISLGIRIGGVLLLVYLCLFFAVRHLQILGEKGFPTNAWSGTAKKFLSQVIPISVLAYTIMLIFWPWAQLDPLFRPIQALLKFSTFSYDIRTFFEGKYILSTEIPWYYGPKWLLLTLPDFLILSLAAGTARLIWKSRRLDLQNVRSLQKTILAIASVFPICMVTLTGTPLCNGTRHLLFAIAPLAVLGAIFAGEIISLVKHRRIPAVILTITLGVGLADMVNLHPNEYIYFNRFWAGGIANASTEYETDYYQHSYTQGIRWINEEYIQPNKGKVKVAGISPSQWYMVDQERFEPVSEPWKADLYVINTHFETHRNIPGEVIHRVIAGGADLLYLIRPDSAYANDTIFNDSVSPHRYSHLGSMLESAGRHEAALANYQTALQLDPGDAHIYNPQIQLRSAIK